MEDQKIRDYSDYGGDLNAKRERDQVGRGYSGEAVEGRMGSD